MKFGILILTLTSLFLHCIFNMSIGLPEDSISAEELYRKSAQLGNKMAEDKVMEIEAKKVVKPWKGDYPTCRMDEFLHDLGIILNLFISILQ